jgi:hypothetical protein
MTGGDKRAPEGQSQEVARQEARDDDDGEARAGAMHARVTAKLGGEQAHGCGSFAQ